MAIRICGAEAWQEYRRLLSSSRALYSPKVPISLETRHIKTRFDYIPPREFLDAIREWLSNRNESSMYYFLTESDGAEATDFELSVDELTPETLMEVNKGRENVLTGKEFAWAIAIDHEGIVHVAGPEDLREVLQKFHPENFDPENGGA